MKGHCCQSDEHLLAKLEGYLSTDVSVLPELPRVLRYVARYMQQTFMLLSLSAVIDTWPDHTVPCLGSTCPVPMLC